MVQIPQEYLGKATSLYDTAMSYEPMPIPDAPPEVSVFRELTRIEKERTGEKFYSQDFVREYMDKKWTAELHNRDCFTFIWDGYCKITNPVKKAKLRDKISKFRVAILNTPNPYRSLRLDMSKYSIPSPLSVQEARVVDIFDGKVVSSE